MIDVSLSDKYPMRRKALRPNHHQAVDYISYDYASLIVPTAPTAPAAPTDPLSVKELNCDIN
jgi:hypothetical protein